MTPKMKRKLRMVGMFLLPVVLVKMTAVMLGARPEAASAAAPDLPALPIAAADEQWTKLQLAASDYIQQQRSEAFGPAPFFYEIRTHSDPPRIDPTPPSIDIKAKLQMVMTGSSGDVALIDSRQYRVGDVLGDSDWVVEQIDVDGAFVTLRHRGMDRTKRLSIERGSD